MKINTQLAVSPTEAFLIGCSYFPQLHDCWLDDIPLEIIDWSLLERLAMTHKLLEPLLLTLQRYELYHLVPINIKTHYIYHHVTQLKKSRENITEIERITTEFCSAGIPLMYLKGVALIPLVYDSGMARNYTDFDLLVPHQYRERAYRLLSEKLGYKSLANESTQRLWVETSYQYPTLHWQRRFTAEIHFQLWHSELPFDPNADKFFNSSQLVKYESLVSISVPSLENMLLHLCIHLYSHHAYANDYHLRHHADICNFVSMFQDTLNWHVFLAAVRDRNANLGIAYALFYTEALYGDLLPEAVRKEIMVTDSVKEFEAIRANGLMNHEAVGYWNVPYVSRLFGHLERSLPLLVDEAVAKHMYRQQLKLVCDQLGVDVNHIQADV